MNYRSLRVATAALCCLPAPGLTAAGAADWLVSVSVDVPASVAAWQTSVEAERGLIAAGKGLRRYDELFRPDAGPRLTGKGHALSGIASYYWQDQMTATGERFDKRALTAAHRTLPFGTKVRVTRVDTGASVVVRINDRGPFKPGRVIDLSERAAQEISMTGRGLTGVKLEVLGR